MSDSNVSMGMVPCRPGCRCADCTIVRQRKRIAELEAELAEAREAIEEGAYLLGLQDLDDNWLMDEADMRPGERRIYYALAGQGGEE